MWRIRWQDDLSTLTVPDPAVAAEDARVRQRITALDTRRVIVALGRDDEEALRVNDRIAEALQASQAAGELDGWQGIARLLPSAAKQHAVFEAVRSSDLAARLPRALERAGFNVQSFAPFFELLGKSEPAPLTYQTLIESPAVELVRSSRVQLEDVPDARVAILTFLRGVNDPSKIEARIAPLAGALYIDQNLLMTDATRDHRVRTSQLLALGLAGVFLVLLLQYRSWRSALSATIPAVLAATVTIAVLGLAGIPLNILGLTSLLMVLSLGVDYAVFLVDAAEGVDLSSQRGLGATLTGLLVSWVSNLCGFGLLAMSPQPALRLIGLIAGIGVTCALIFAPTALVLRHHGASPHARP
jgi:predicted exporter